MNILMLNGPSFPLTADTETLVDEQLEHLSKAGELSELDKLAVLLARPFRSSVIDESALKGHFDYLQRLRQSLKAADVCVLDYRIYNAGPGPNPDPEMDTDWLELPFFSSVRGVADPPKETMNRLNELLGIVPALMTNSGLRCLSSTPLRGYDLLKLQMVGGDYAGYDCPRLAPGSPLWTACVLKEGCANTLITSPMAAKPPDAAQVGGGLDMSIEQTLVNEALKIYGSVPFSVALGEAFETRSADPLLDIDKKKENA